MFNLLRSLVFGVLFILANASTPHPWYETLPAVALDYKVHIDAGKEDCYFQYVNAGATLYVNFQVYNYFRNIYSTGIVYLHFSIRITDGYNINQVMHIVTVELVEVGF